MGRSKFTILIVSPGGKAPRHFQISKYIIFLSAAVFLLLAVNIGVLYLRNRDLSETAAQVPILESENNKLASRLSHLETELTGLSKLMEDLEVLGEEVRGLVSGEGSLPDRSGTRLRAEPEDPAGTISYLREAIPQKSQELEELLEDAAAYRDRLERTPDLVPVRGRITSDFGWRRHPLSRRRQFHTGVDFGASPGTAVHAAAKGTVVSASFRAFWGKLIIISHGTYVTHYAHLRRIEVKAGQTVQKGERIGQVGSTGISTGPHLHFEIHKNGRPIDPLEVLNMEVSHDEI